MRSLIGTLRYWYFFRQFHSIHQKLQAAIRAWQAERLRSLIPYLGAHIPLYSRLLAAHRIKAEDIATLDDLPKLPLMSKETFRNEPVNEYIDESHSPTGSWVTTSGTTGVLFSPLRRAIAQMPFYSDSLRYRFLMRTRPWLPDATWASIAYIRVLPLKRKNSIVVSAESLLSDPVNALEDIKRFQPKVIEGHASLLTVLAQESLRHDIRLSPSYLVSASEHLLPESRRLIEERFGCKVYERYGLEEFGPVATECAEHEGFHINAESFIVEVVDARGAPLRDGARGRILITDLYNYEMPFVRYDTGDRGYISWERCSCGLESPRLWIEGRYEAFLTFPHRRYHQFEFSELMQTFAPYMYQYQIAKLNDAETVVRIIPNKSCTDEVIKDMRERLAELLSPVSVRIERMSSIARSSRGKSHVVIDESECGRAKV